MLLFMGLLYPIHIFYVPSCVIPLHDPCAFSVSVHKCHLTLFLLMPVSPPEA